MTQVEVVKNTMKRVKDSVKGVLDYLAENKEVIKMVLGILTKAINMLLCMMKSGAGHLLEGVESLLRGNFIETITNRMLQVAQ